MFLDTNEFPLNVHVATNRSSQSTIVCAPRSLWGSQSIEWKMPWVRWIETFLWSLILGSFGGWRGLVSPSDACWHLLVHRRGPFVAGRPVTKRRTRDWETCLFLAVFRSSNEKGTAFVQKNRAAIEPNTCVSLWGPPTSAYATLPYSGGPVTRTAITTTWFTWFALLCAKKFDLNRKCVKLRVGR